MNEPLLGEFRYNTYCTTDGESDEMEAMNLCIFSEMSPLNQQTVKYAPVNILMHFPYTLPEGYCHTAITILVDINGHNRTQNIQYVLRSPLTISFFEEKCFYHLYTRLG